MWKTNLAATSFTSPSYSPRVWKISQKKCCRYLESLHPNLLINRPTHYLPWTVCPEPSCMRSRAAASSLSQIIVLKNIKSFAKKIKMMLRIPKWDRRVMNLQLTLRRISLYLTVQIFLHYYLCKLCELFTCICVHACANAAIVEGTQFTPCILHDWCSTTERSWMSPTVCTLVFYACTLCLVHVYVAVQVHVYTMERDYILSHFSVAAWRCCWAARTARAAPPSTTLADWVSMTQ